MSKEQYHELADYIVDYFKEKQSSLNLPVDLKYVYQADDKQKALIKISKIPDKYAVLLESEVLVSFNEDYFDAFDDESKAILVEQELALLEFDLDKGQLKIGKPDLMTSSGILSKYGVDAVGRANQLRELYTQQQADKK
jgi:hypothetical protein